MNNLLPSGTNGTGMPIAAYAESTAQVSKQPLLSLVSRLDAVMGVMKTRKGETYTNPWKVLHPEEDVNSLGDALNPMHDTLYLKSATDNPVSYSMCTSGYLARAESPRQPLIYGEGGDWSLLT